MTTFAMAMLVCSDLERSREFYRVVLGLKLRTNAVPHWVDFELSDGSVLGLHPASESLSVRPGTLQLAFYVANVDRFVTDARAAGVRILQEPYDDRGSNARIAVIADPDGYPVQVGAQKRG